MGKTAWKVLGNNSLEMCKKYLALVQDDLKTALRTFAG